MNNVIEDPGLITGGKILSLKEAVSQYIHPGMKLHLAGGMGGPGAAICEIIRQYYGKDPGFELIQSTVTGHSINLLHCNLIKKMVFSACVDISPSGRPSRVMQKKWADKSILFENWSLCSLQQRLFAGALGLNFMPTRSVSGSSLAQDNRENFLEITDPFDGISKVGLVRSLNPDISIVHGCVADKDGNTILGIPYGEDIWGAFASTGGVVVTVEKVVPEDFIRNYPALVKIPGYLVKAVCRVPLGVHPFSLASPGIPGFSGYESDTAFLEDLHKASSDGAKLDAWIQEWVLDCHSPEEYLQKLGNQRLASLQYRPGEERKEEKKTGSRKVTDGQPAYTSEEMMLIAASREIIRSVLEKQHKVVLLGAGSRSVAVLMAYRILKSRGCDINIITGNGQYGYNPLPGELGLQNLTGVYSSRMVMDTLLSQGVIIGGKNNRCLGVLGSGQIDKYGNTNSTLTSSGQFLVGSGGANDVGNASEVFVILNQSRDRFVEVLPYITCPGERVTTVISTLGIFKKDVGKKELYLAACLPDAVGTPLMERLQKVRAECSWPLDISGRLEDVPGPTAEELEGLRQMMG